MGCSGAQQHILLGGMYGGRAVTCGDSGCFPLAIGMSYAICGQWEPNPTANNIDADPAKKYWLTIDTFCEAL
jgi:hypothetical protein